MIIVLSRGNEDLRDFIAKMERLDEQRDQRGWSFDQFRKVSRKPASAQERTMANESDKTRIFLSYARDDDGEPHDSDWSFVVQLYRDTGPIR